MKAWHVLLIAIVMVVAAVDVSAATPTIDIKLTQGQKVADAKGNILTGTEIQVMANVSSVAVAAPCNIICKIKKLLNLQSVDVGIDTQPSTAALATPEQITALKDNVMRIGESAPLSCSAGSTCQFTPSQVYEATHIPFTYHDKDGNVYFRKVSNGGSSWDPTALDPLVGENGVTGEAVNTVFLSESPKAYWPVPKCGGAETEGLYNIEGHKDGSASVTCGVSSGSGFFQVGMTDTYSFTIDTSNGLDSEIVDYGVVYARNQSAKIKVRVENKIADGILGGLVLEEKSLTFTQSTNITTLDAVPLMKGNNTFDVTVPTELLGRSQIKAVPYVKVEIPYVALERDPTAMQGSGLRPVYRNQTWYGTDDQAITMEYQVLYPEQIGPDLRSGSIAYKSPYVKMSTKTFTIVSTKSTLTSSYSTRNVALIGLGLLVAVGTIFYFLRRH